MAQTVMGEFIIIDKRNRQHRNSYYEDQAKGAYNSKRVDLLIINSKGMPVIAIEYQVDGHFGKTKQDRLGAIRRDEAKRLAYLKADISYVEVISTQNAPHDETLEAFEEALIKLLKSANSYHYSILQDDDNDCVKYHIRNKTDVLDSPTSVPEKLYKLSNRYRELA